jgi:hypothetical protein
MRYRLRCVKQIIVELDTASPEQAYAEVMSMDLDSMTEWQIQEPECLDQPKPELPPISRVGFDDDEWLEEE